MWVKSKVMLWIARLLYFRWLSRLRRVSRLTAVRSFSRQQTVQVQDVRVGLGLSDHIRPFVTEYANISRTSNALTRRNARCAWESAQQRSLQIRVWHIPTFIFSCDASSYAISAILSQLQNDKSRRIDFNNFVFNSAQINCNTTEKEMQTAPFSTWTQVFPLRVKILW